MSSVEYSPHSSTTIKFPSITIGTLPSLPEIRSGLIRKRIFTRSSLAWKNRITYDSKEPESGQNTDNDV